MFKKPRNIFYLLYNIREKDNNVANRNTDFENDCSIAFIRGCFSSFLSFYVIIGTLWEPLKRCQKYPNPYNRSIVYVNHEPGYKDKDENVRFFFI